MNLVNLQGSPPPKLDWQWQYSCIFFSIGIASVAILPLYSIIGQPAGAAGPHNLNFKSSGNIFVAVVNKVEDSSVNSLRHHFVNFDSESA